METQEKIPMAKRLWHWLRALEDAADHDRAEATERRLRKLERRLEILERG